MGDLIPFRMFQSQGRPKGQRSGDPRPHNNDATRLLAALDAEVLGRMRAATPSFWRDLAESADLPVPDTATITDVVDLLAQRVAVAKHPSAR